MVFYLVGPFPPPTLANRWVAVTRDFLKRYVITAALPSSSPVEAANFNNDQVLLKHGAPQVLLSDRGWPYLAQLLQEIF